jgi:hypothetical protein
MSPQDRMNGFGGYIGVEPIVGCFSLLEIFFVVDSLFGIDEL